MSSKVRGVVRSRKATPYEGITKAFLLLLLQCVCLCMLLCALFIRCMLHSMHTITSLVNALCDTCIMTCFALSCLSDTVTTLRLDLLMLTENLPSSFSICGRRKTTLEMAQAVSTCLPGCLCGCIVFIMSLRLKNAIWNLFGHLRFSCIQI